MVDIYSLIFKSIQSDLTKSGQSISIFGKEWRNVVNDIRNAKGLGNKISAAFSTGLSDNDISRLKEYNNLINKGQNPQTAYYRTLKNASAAAQDLAMKANGAAVSEETLTAATNKLTISQRIATVASKAMGIALQVALNVGVALAINGIISLIDYLVNKEQKAIETANELGKAYKDQKDRLSDLKQEYLDIVDSSKSETEKTKDLYEWKKKLIKAYGYEKDAIEGVTTARATGLKFFDEEEQKDAQELINKTLDEYEKAYKKIYGGSVGSKTGYANGILSPDALDWLKQYKDIVAEISDIDVENSDTELSFSFGDNIYDAITRINEVLTGLNTLENNGVELTYAQKEVKRLFKSYLDEYEKAKTEAETILSETGSALFTDQFVEFLKIDENKLDKVNADNFEAWKEKFRKYLEENAKELLKDTNFVKIMDEYFSNLRIELFPDTLVSQNNKYGYSLSALSEKLEALGDTIKDVSTKQSTIQSALEKVRAGTFLTSDEMQKLGDAYPDLLGKFEETVDGWTIGADELIDANDKIVESAKDAINEQKKLLNDTISKIRAQLANTPVINSKSDYDEWQAKQAQLNKDLKDAQNQLQGLDNLSKNFSSNLSNLNKKLEEFNNTLKTYSSNISTGVSAQKEMNENGKISASTLESLLSLGDDYIKCIIVENGIIKFNADIFKEVTKAKLEDEIATLKLAKAEAIRARIDDAMYNKGGRWKELQAIIDETSAKLEAAEALLGDFDFDWDKALGNGSGSGTDDTDKQYNKQLDKLKKASDGTQKAEEELIQNWINLNDTFYATSDPDKWAENYDTIGDYTQKFYKDLLDKGILNVDQYKDKINAFFETMKAKGIDLGKSWLANALGSVSVDDAMSSWDLENGYDSDKSKNDFKLRQDRIDEFRKQIVKAYGVDGVNNVKAYTDAMKEADEQQQKLNEDTYVKTKENLSADGDKTLFNILSDADELWNKTLTLFAGNDDVIKSNAKDIFGTVSSALEDALKKGIITVDGYESLLRSWADTLQVTEADVTDALVDTYEYRADALQKANDGSLASERKYIADMKALNFSTYGDEDSDFYDPTTYASNLRDITDHQLDVLEKALNNGEISVQEYANSVVEIFKDADVLGADYVSEKLDDIDKVRAEREKTYWEQQKELMEDYYDKQIKEIEDTQKAKEKENKLEELHLKLIKARQTLEEAKNNRNQLVFHDGTFEYMADQDAVMSAEEEVANTLKEIEDEKLQAQIDLLEEQKDAALGFYDQILDEIDFYLNKTLPLSESDQEELAKIRNSDYAQYARDKRDGNLTANSDNEKIAEDALNQSDTAEETKQSVSDIAKNVLDIGKLLAEGFNFANLVKALGGNPMAEAVKNFQDSYNATLVGKQITPSTLPSNITNNSSTTNNSAKTINVGDIHLHFDLTLNSLDEFVDGKIDEALLEVGRYVKQKLPVILAKA